MFATLFIRMKYRFNVTSIVGKKVATMAVPSRKVWLRLPKTRELKAKAAGAAFMKACTV